MGPRRFKLEFVPDESVDALTAFSLPTVAPPPPKLARQRPAMALRDEVVLLLHVASEIEHSLMVQYLYAAYSVPESGPRASWRSLLLQIAKEEMGHLLSVQNLLLAVSGPLNFDREDHPYNELYAFPFRLEPLSVTTAARYVLAEMPDPETIPPEMGFDLDEVIADSKSDGTINRVGALFDLLSTLAAQLDESDLNASSLDFQGDRASWRAEINGLVLERVSSVSECVALIDEIGEQGEGLSTPSDADGPSHFERFYTMYREVKSFTGGPVSRPMPTDPTVRDESSPGYLRDPTAYAWGDVLNHRYRWVLASIQHALCYPSGQARALLQRWAFLDMAMLGKIAEEMSTIPQSAGSSTVAGPPFELPYTLNLPTRPDAIARHHLGLARHSIEQIKAYGLESTLAKQLSILDSQRIDECVLLEQSM